MKLICVGGLSSGSGKTSVVCLLLKAFPGWAAMKITPSRPGHVCSRGRECGACRPPEGVYEVSIDDEIPQRPRTSTTRFIEAGATHAAFVRALPDYMPVALESALGRLSDASGVIIESTTAMPMVDGLRILVAREGWSEVKDSARRAATLMDVIALNREQAGLLEGIPASSPFAVEFPERRLIPVCAALPPDDPMNRDFIDYCRTYLETETGDT